MISAERLNYLACEQHMGAEDDLPTMEEAVELASALLAARARITELERQLNERGADIVNQQQLLNSGRAQGLSQEDRADAEFYRHCVVNGFPKHLKIAPSIEQRWAAFAKDKTFYGATPEEAMRKAIDSARGAQTI